MANYLQGIYPYSQLKVAGKYNVDQLFHTGYFCLQNKQYRDAYLCFSPICQQVGPPSAPPNAAALFNLALCYIEAEIYPEAISLLDKAIVSFSGQSIAPFSDLKRTEIYQALIKKESASDCYSEPMMQEIPALFPRLAKERMLRVMVDTLVLCERWGEVIRLAGGLTAAGHKNILEAFALAQEKTEADKEPADQAAEAEA